MKLPPISPISSFHPNDPFCCLATRLGSHSYLSVLSPSVFPTWLFLPTPAARSSRSMPKMLSFPLRNLPELLPRLGCLPPAAPAHACPSSCGPGPSSDEHIKDIQPKSFSLAPHPKVSSPSPSIILLLDAESRVRTSQNVTSVIALSLRFHILFLPSQIQFSIFSFQAIAMSDLSAATLTYLFSFPGVAAVSWPSFCLSFSSSFCSLS